VINLVTFELSLRTIDSEDDKMTNQMQSQTRLRWTPVDFGKHKGRRLLGIMFRDPDWFVHVRKKGALNARSGYYDEAEELFAKSTSIRVLQTGTLTMVVDHNFHHGTSIGFDLVPVDRPPHQGSTQTMRSEWIDMRGPHNAANHDKAGNRLFLRSLKCYYFGDPSARVTRERCEAFFNDDSNFHRFGRAAWINMTTIMPDRNACPVIDKI